MVGTLHQWLVDVSEAYLPDAVELTLTSIEGKSTRAASTVRGGQQSNTSIFFSPQNLKTINTKSSLFTQEKDGFTSHTILQAPSSQMMGTM